MFPFRCLGRTKVSVHCYVCIIYLISVLRYISTQLHLREKWCEYPWLFFEAVRGPQKKRACGILLENAANIGHSVPFLSTDRWITLSGKCADKFLSFRNWEWAFNSEYLSSRNKK
jgi:hypothetical protein